MICKTKALVIMFLLVGCTGNEDIDLLIRQDSIIHAIDSMKYDLATTTAKIKIIKGFR